MSDAVLDIPLLGGPDDQTDPRLLPPGSVVSAFNQVYDLDGSYQPRFGYVQVGGGALPSIRRLAVFAEELLAVDGHQLFSYDPEPDTWKLKDAAPGPGVTHRPLFNTTTNFIAYNEAFGNGYRVVAWIDALNSTALIRAAVYSVETGAMVLGPVQVSATGRATTSVQVAIVGTTALVAWVDVVAPAVAGASLSLTNIAAGFGSVTTLSDVSNPPVNGTYGFSLWATATRFGIVYETAPTGGGSNNGTLITRNFNTALTALNQSVTHCGLHYYQSISIASAAVDGADLWVVVSATGFITDSVLGPSVWAIQFDANSVVALTGPIDCGSDASGLGIAKTGVATDTTGVHRAVVTFSGAGTAGAFGSLFYNWVTPTGPILSAAIEVPNIVQSSTPIFDAGTGRAYVYALSPTLFAGVLGTVWGSYYLLNLGTSAVPTKDLVAILAPRIVNDPGLGNTSTWAHTPHLGAGPDSSYELCMPIVDNRGRQGMDLFAMDFAAPYRWSPASLGRESYLSGQIYDGNLLSEIGFARNPLITSVVAGGSGSFTGTWEYVVTFGRVNAQGDLEESAPSIPVQVTASSNAHFTIDVLSLTVSQKWRTAYGSASGTASPVYIIVYRTQALANGDTLHYRVFNEPLPAALLNVDTSSLTIIVDTTTDSSLTDGTHPILYTDSGELPHNCPETFTHCVTHKNRLWGIAADQRTIWYSQTYSQGTTPDFNELQTLTVDDTPEPLIALASLYDKLLIFTQTRIYVVFGDGPSISGAGNDLTTPQRIPSPSGCLDPRSVVNTPMGVMFQAIMGLMLIDPGFSVTFLGKSIVNALAPYPVCSSANWCEDTSTVRFTFTNLDGGSAGSAAGVLALYDVRRSRWAVHSISNNATGSDLAPLQCGAWHPTLGFLTGYIGFSLGVPGFTAREATLADPTPWLDFGTTFVPLLVALAWLKGSSGDSKSLQGARRFRRLRVLGQFYESHGLSVQLGYDYAAPSETHTYSAATVLGFVVGTREQTRVVPQYGKGEAIQVTLSTVEPSPHPGTYTGHAAGFTGLQLEVHDRKGGYKNIGASAKS